MRTQLPSALLATALACTYFAAPAQAQAPRTFVSAAGSDSNPCSFAAPCRHFQAAVNATSAGGEVDALDPAGYGPITISQAITINGNGWAAITPPSGGSGITINADSNAAIRLNGLLINGGGIGQTGISFSSGGSLIIANCTVAGLTSSGIALAPNADAKIVVSRTLVADNGGHGIYLQPSAGGVVSGIFNHVEVYNNGLQGIGVFANAMCCSAFLKAMIVDSVSSFNGNAGIYALGGTVPLNLNVARSTTMANAQSGLRAEASVYVTIAQSNLEDGWTGLPQNNQFPNVCSYGDNYTDGALPPTCISPLSKY
jgi:Right handed beta helix region